VLIFGFTGILGKLITIDSIPLVFWRTTLGGLVILVWLVLRGRLAKMNGRDLLKIAGVGLVVGMHWILFFESIKVSTVSVALVMFATTPMFVGFIEPIIFRRKLDWKELVVSLMVIAGVSTIFNMDTGYTLGMTLGLVSALMAALFSTLNGALVKKHSPSNISMVELLSASIGIAIFLSINGGMNADLFRMSSSNWLYIGVLAVVATSFAFIASTAVMKHLTPFTAAIVINLEPIYSIVLAVLIFGQEEVMGWEFYFGGSLIIGAVVANTLMNKMLK
jgi:drug/metabolite transporter (DMT)-like permease